MREIFALAATISHRLKKPRNFFKPSRINAFCLYRAYRCGTHPQTSRCHQPHMGLTSYKGEEVRKGDVRWQKIISPRMRSANLIAWLIVAGLCRGSGPSSSASLFARLQDKLDQFLQFNDREVLQGAVKSARKWPMKKRRRSMFSLPTTTALKRSRRREGYRWFATVNKESKK